MVFINILGSKVSFFASLFFQLNWRQLYSGTRNLMEWRLLFNEGIAKLQNYEPLFLEGLEFFLCQWAGSPWQAIIPWQTISQGGSYRGGSGAADVGYKCLVTICVSSKLVFCHNLCYIKIDFVTFVVLSQFVFCKNNI